MPRRVAVTGLGIVCALGAGAKVCAAALREGRSGIRPMTLVDASLLRFANAAEADGFTAADHLDARDIDLLDRSAQMALVAAKEAISDSGIAFGGELGARTAIVTGTSAGGQIAMDSQFFELYAKGNTRIHPMSIPRVMSNAGASHIAMKHGITGPAWTVSTACSSSNHAIGQAYWMVRDGRAEAAVAGGHESPFSLGFLKAWEAMRVVSPDTCRPFSRDRKGLILGEGAAFLILEPLDAALARGARIHGEICGFGMTSDAHHITQPRPETAAAAISAALADGGVNAGDVGYINAHGTGTPLNDPAETKAIHLVFGDRASRIPVSSTKSMHGHGLGAAGALEAFATVVALRDGFLPPTANYTEPDPDCDLDVVPNTAREARANVAVSNSFAFGGLNAAVVFRSPAAL